MHEESAVRLGNGRNVLKQFFKFENLCNLYATCPVM